MSAIDQQKKTKDELFMEFYRILTAGWYRFYDSPATFGLCRRLIHWIAKNPVHLAMLISLSYKAGYRRGVVSAMDSQEKTLSDALSSISGVLTDLQLSPEATESLILPKTVRSYGNNWTKTANYSYRSVESYQTG